MSFLLVLSIVGEICSIIGFVINLYVSKLTKSENLRWIIIFCCLLVFGGSAVYYSSENERIKNIHRQAKAIYDDYVPSGNEKEFIQESLAFLEENKDRYPDSYNRAVQIYSDMKNSTIQYSYEPAIEIRGIIKGIVTLNGE